MNEEDRKESKNVPEKKRGFIASVIVGLIGLFCTFYLINPGAGVLELIPDNVPVVGNLDEAGAAALLVSCLAYFGLDIGGLFGRFKRKEEEEPDTREVKGEVIDS